MGVAVAAFRTSTTHVESSWHDQTQLWQDPRSPTHNELNSLAMLALVALGSSPYTGETSAICRAVFGFAEQDSDTEQEHSFLRCSSNRR
eukprot:g38984.t1